MCLCVFEECNISTCQMRQDFIKVTWSKVWVFPTLPGHFCWCSFILIVTCRYETAGSRASFVLSQKPPALDANISGHSWNTHHLTCHSVTIPSALCGKLQAQRCTQTQTSAWIGVPYDHRCVSLETRVCVCVCVFHAWLWSGILHMTWYDDTGPIKGWGWVKESDDRASRKLYCDLTSERNRNTRGGERGRVKWEGFWEKKW